MGKGRIIRMDDAGKQRNFIGYEYKEIETDSSRGSFLLDGYENFGWETDENFQGRDVLSHVHAQEKVVLRLRRNRKIINKMELTRLQRNFEACLNEIDALEKAKTARATMDALIVGLIGTAFMAGATFAVTAASPHYVLMVFLAIPGVIGWIAPCFLYRKAIVRQAKKQEPLIEAKYDEIYEICEKGHKLLY